MACLLVMLSSQCNAGVPLVRVGTPDPGINTFNVWQVVQFLYICDSLQNTDHMMGKLEAAQLLKWETC